MSFQHRFVSQLRLIFVAMRWCYIEPNLRSDIILWYALASLIDRTNIEWSRRCPGRVCFLPVMPGFFLMKNHRSLLKNI